MTRPTILVAVAVALAGCSTVPEQPRGDMLRTLAAHCGRAFGGRIVSPPVPADAAFAGKRLVMHVRECSEDAVRVPFHVGDDRSRTWVLTRTATALRLKHDHRHQDGTPDKITQYGGDSIDPPTVERQHFPADEETKALLLREGNAAGVDNVWAIEATAQAFAYELRRPNRFFRVEFDLTEPVSPPPPPWGN